ncbi:MAG: AbrB family transcriptional regulator [Desulfosarcina sp.]|nr:AbrB family transcriptional regulator [Desulfobacterales bacterium]
MKTPAGSLIVAMLTIIVFKLITKTHWEMPRGFNFFLQVFLGIMVGASFQPAMLPLLKTLFFPVLASTLTLVGVGVLLSIIFTRMGILDAPAAYLGTSPGAMSALIVLAFESGSSATMVVCFHFFRVVFVILTAPLFLKFFSH